jgi:hypothetical protein
LEFLKALETVETETCANWASFDSVNLITSLYYYKKEPCLFQGIPDENFFENFKIKCNFATED